PRRTLRRDELAAAPPVAKAAVRPKAKRTDRQRDSDFLQTQGGIY
ncbi:MAG: hypothetical protein QOG72_1870, partial [Sphingomonadales bacterium]|nr:hypothetical protein [Sphingomonadales bacterium]